MDRLMFGVKVFTAVVCQPMAALNTCEDCTVIDGIPVVSNVGGV